VFSVALMIVSCVLNGVFSLVFSIMFSPLLPSITSSYHLPFFTECVLPFVKKETALVREQQGESSLTLDAKRKKAADVDAQTNEAQQQVEALKQKIEARGLDRRPSAPSCPRYWLPMKNL
jgi:hypothetical protein